MSGKGNRTKRDENLLGKDEIWDDSELIKMYDASVKGNFNIKEKDPKEEKTKEWKVGDTCMAPFDDLWYQATILSISTEDKTARVHFLEYGDDDDADVELSELFLEDEVQFNDEAEDGDVENIEMDIQQEGPSVPKPQLSSSIPVPKILPPPPEIFEAMNNETEISNNMMISWYMSGYHTGYYQAMRDFKASAKKP